MKKTNNNSEDIPGEVGRNKRIIVLALKILVTITLFAILFTYIDFHETLNKINSLGIVSAIWILTLLTLQQILSALRWSIILNKIGESYSRGKIIQVFLAGAVASSLLITSLAGLSVRVVLLTKLGTRVDRVLYSLAFEKLFASGTLLICFVVGMAVLINDSGSNLTENFRLAMYLGIGALVLIMAGLLMLAWLRFEKASNLLEMIRNVVIEPRAFATILLFSIAIIALSFYSISVIALGLEIDVSLVALIAIQPGIAVMSALPLSLGGWGVREVSMVLGLGMLGVESKDALAISLTYGLLSILSTFIAAGASLLIRVRSSKGSAQ
jgi:uncharacterized membrane protein YbhN (UPF0104 family)